ncbi:MAG: ribosome assembly RNA-binding protein YhbY [Treponema sp.]|nr:ribosome assembly RNA-binding protein YhbY [Treponema sp.]
MMELTSKQRKVLEKAAHSLEPVVIVGQNGVTDSLVDMTKEQLKQHELIKIKFNEFKEEKQTLSGQLAESCDATLVRIIGNVAIMYKESEEDDKKVYAKALAKAAAKTSANV